MTLLHTATPVNKTAVHSASHWSMTSSAPAVVSRGYKMVSVSGEMACKCVWICRPESSGPIIPIFIMILFTVCFLWPI